MHAIIDIGVEILEWMFGIGLVVSCLAIVLGLIDDVKTFIKY